MSEFDPSIHQDLLAHFAGQSKSKIVKKIYFTRQLIPSDGRALEEVDVRGSDNRRPTVIIHMLRGHIAKSA